jgi:predicted Rossmann fold flavoprotein
MASKSDLIWDLVVVGAGAAGMLAAIRAGRLGCRTLLLEKNRKPGVKILMSGGTRCNLTHATDAGGIIEAFGRQGRFLRTSLIDFDPERVIQFFHDAGVTTKVESTGKVFPTSDRALDVQQALWREVHGAGVHAVLDAAVERVDRVEGMWRLASTQGLWHGRRLVVTTGGCSYAGCGTRGDGYAWMSELGHTIVSPHPALVPLTSPSAWIAPLSGVTLEDTLVRVIETERIPTTRDVAERLAVCRRQSLAERRGSLLFTHFGLSGPAAMDVSREFTACADPMSRRLICDLLPMMSAQEFHAQLQIAAADQATRSIARWLGQWLPARLAEVLVTLSGIPAQQRLAELTKVQRRELLQQTKSLEIAINGSRGFAKAEVTAGGVSLLEVDPRTMASKVAPDLFIAGELLDVDGPIGGYNFQAAFSTGWSAASAAARA